MTARPGNLSVREHRLGDAFVTAGIVGVSGIVGVAIASSSPVAVLPIAALVAGGVSLLRLRVPPPTRVAAYRPILD